MEFSTSHLRRVLSPDFFRFSDQNMSGVSTDTRTLKEGELFIAIKGKHHDGLDHIEEAIARKAACLMVSRRGFFSRGLHKRTYPQGMNVILVEDTIKAYGVLAKDRMSQLPGKKIAITGSAGKTSTKDLLASLLATRYRVFASQKNYNNHIGVPFNIFSIERPCDYYLFELGMNHPGEIEWLSFIVEPDISIITNILPAHVGHFKDMRDLAKAKSEVFRYQKKSGYAILPAQDLYFDSLKGYALKEKITRIVPYRRDTLQLDTTVGKNTGFSSRLHLPDRTIPVAFNGPHNQFNASLAYSLAEEESLPLEDIRKGFAEAKLKASRFQIVASRPLVVDDAYNANPASVIEIVEWLWRVTAKMNKCFIIGDILELGEKAKYHHEEIGRRFNDLPLTKGRGRIVFVGPWMRYAYQKCPNQDTIYCENIQKAYSCLTKRLDPHGFYFFKASNGMGFDWLIDRVRCSTT